jgi:hypothetical protein
VAKGHRSRYTLRIAKRICEHIALGDTLKQALAKEPLGPHIVTMWRWLDEHPEFRQMYDRARLMQADLRVDKLAEMAEEAIAKPRNAAAYKVAADIYWRQCEIANPEKYGRKIEVNQKTTPPNPDELRKEIRRLERELGMKDGAQIVDVTPKAITDDKPENAE